MTDTRDTAGVVVPFGKHRGATVAEQLLEKDPAYADWLLAQGWLAERFRSEAASMTAPAAGRRE